MSQDQTTDQTEIITNQVGEVVVLTLQQAHLDWSNVEGVKQAMAPLLATNAKVVVDMSQTTFIDSVGLSLFISSLRKLRQNQGELKVAGLRRQVKFLFEMVRMDRVLESFETWQEAVESF